jgi:hypothetical protein
MDTSVWWSGDLFCAMRSTLGADRSREHLEATPRQDTVTNHHLRAEQVVDWATRGGAKALHRDDTLGSLEPGKKADVVLIKNDDSPVMFPILHPYGHVAFQAQRSDVHTVIVDGKIVKSEGKLVGIDLKKARHAIEQTVEFAMGELGEEAWTGGMHPEIPRPSWPRTRTSTPNGGSDERPNGNPTDPDRSGRHRGDPRGARAPPGDRGGVARGAEVPHRGRSRGRVRPAVDVTRTSVLIDAMSHTA